MSKCEDYIAEGADRSLTWGGRFIWKNPLDLFVYAEIVREVQPTLIIETGTHEGGSALFWADMLRLNGIRGSLVLTIDSADSGLHLDDNIDYLVGDSVSPKILAEVYARASLFKPYERVLVDLDSNHSYPHVTKELEAYAPLVTPGSYLIVEDGIDEIRFERKGVLSATRNFLESHPEFEADRSRERYRITNCPEGFLRRR